MADATFSRVQQLVDAVGSPLERMLLLSCTLPTRRPLVAQAYAWAIDDDEALFARVGSDETAKRRFVEKMLRRLSELLLAHVQAVGAQG